MYLFVEMTHGNSKKSSRLSTQKRVGTHNVSPFILRVS
jgi:hypothetical protein